MTKLLESPADKLVRFHLSLNVSDMDASVKFYTTLLAVPPAKWREGYAKFEIDAPPVVLSLEHTPRGAGGVLSHLGLRMSDAEQLAAVQARLETAGLRTRREEGVECCYARQTKFWVADPDGTLWEIYTLDDDLAHRGEGQALDAMLPDAGCRAAVEAHIHTASPTGPAPAAAVEFEHRLGSPVPEKLAFADGSVDEVRLRGTFNRSVAADRRDELLREVRRVLRPGGRVVVYSLVSDRPAEGPLGLPGPAAAVEVVPVEDEVPAWLATAGFLFARVTKFDVKPCFVRPTSQMRQQQVEAVCPTEDDGDRVEVLYKGPFRTLTADDCITFVRGRRVAVPRDVLALFPAAELARDFTVFG